MSNFPVGGGRSNFNLIPVRSDGSSREFDVGDVDIVGVHTGDYAGLNVANPQSGFLYQWSRNDPNSRFVERGRGGQVVQQGDPDFPAYELGIVEDESDMPTALDTSQVYQDVVLMRYPEERIRQRREEEANRAEARVANAHRAFIEGATENEVQTGHGNLTRFARRDHSLRIEGDDGRTSRQWTPDRGILDD